MQYKHWYISGFAMILIFLVLRQWLTVVKGQKKLQIVKK